MKRFLTCFLAFICTVTIFSQKFTHPGLLHDNDDIARMHQLIADKNPVALGSFEKFKANPKSSSSYKMKGPFEIIGRDGAFANTKLPTEDDFNAVYYNSLMWAITSESAYADKAMEIIRAYADSLRCISGEEAALCAGLQGFMLINACEIMRWTSELWTKQDTKATERMFENVFSPVINDFKSKSPNTNGSLAAAVNKMRIALAVYTESRKLYKEACEMNIEDTSMLGLGCLAEACEVAWHQGDDLYDAHSNRLLSEYEYTAKVNLGYDVEDIENVSDIGIWRNVFEIAYNHYVGRQHLSMPFTAMAMRYVRPEGQGYACDNSGFGSLFFYRNTPTDTSTPIVSGSLDVKHEVEYCLTQLSRTLNWLDTLEQDSTLIPYSIAPYENVWQRRKSTPKNNIRIYWDALLGNAAKAMKAGYGENMTVLREKLQPYFSKEFPQPEIPWKNLNLDSVLLRLPKDMVPTWNLESPELLPSYKDTKTACVLAIKLIELSDSISNSPVTDWSQRPTGVKYRKAAVKILQRLSSDFYQSRESKPSFLLHSIGDMNTGTEIDYSTIITDYFYLEALLRL